MMLKSVLDELDAIRTDLGTKERRLKAIHRRLKALLEKQMRPTTSDEFTAWLCDQCSPVDPKAVTSAEDLHKSFLAWSRAKGLPDRSQKWLGRQLRLQGLVSRKSGGVILYTGIHLEDPEQRAERIHQETLQCFESSMKSMTLRNKDGRGV